MHGGDIYRNKVALDFSVNINPLGIPAAVRAALSRAVEESICYPDDKCEELISALADRFSPKMCSVEHSSLDPAQICVGNGASELFLAIAHSLKPRKVLLQAPSFSGYTKCLEALDDCRVDYVYCKEAEDFVLTKSVLEQMTEDVDLLILANPNNPTGRLIPEELLQRILERATGQGIVVVLDECFLELSSGSRQSGITRMKAGGVLPQLIVVRAFTKSFAIPGVRLGYCVCSEKGLASRIRRHLPEWNVSVYAQRAGVVALREVTEDYLGKARALVEKERALLSRRLAGMGFKVYPSDANYILFFSEKELYEPLLKKRILIRDCRDYEGLGEGFYRIAVRSEAAHERLLRAMEEIL